MQESLIWTFVAPEMYYKNPIWQ